MDREEETVRGEDMMVCCQENEAGVYLIWEGGGPTFATWPAVKVLKLKRWVLSSALSSSSLAPV